MSARPGSFAVVCALVGAAASACDGDPPRMHAAARALAGEGVLVRFDAPVASRPPDAVWVTLAPADSPDAYVGERVLVDDGARDVTLVAPSPGAWEVRLHDEFPARSFHVVARARVDVEAPPVAGAAPPLWYW